LFCREGETVKRPFGVIFSAILLFLGSLFQLLMAVLMAFSGALVGKIPPAGLHGATAPPPIPGWMPVFMYGLSAFFVALAVWGILTTVGLFRLRLWARYSVLVIGGGLALINGIQMLFTAIWLFVPMPVAPTVDASQAHTTLAATKIVFAVLALIYAVLCAVGISWLVYFNLKWVREVFAGAPGEIAESPRPFPISVLAVLSMIGAACCLLTVFLPLPGALFGWILDGWGKVMLYLVFTVLSAAVGIGLWRLREWGRLLMLGLMAAGLANSMVYLLRPALLLQYNTELYRRMNVPQPQVPAQFQTMMPIATFGFAILFTFGIAAVLIHYRYAFKHPIEPPRNEATALP
jgi:hypothetical protein